MFLVHPVVLFANNEGIRREVVTPAKSQVMCNFGIKNISVGQIPVEVESESSVNQHRHQLVNRTDGDSTTVDRIWCPSAKCELGNFLSLRGFGIIGGRAGKVVCYWRAIWQKGYIGTTPNTNSRRFSRIYHFGVPLNRASFFQFTKHLHLSYAYRLKMWSRSMSWRKHMAWL